jgi:hypothetical protein
MKRQFSRIAMTFGLAAVMGSTLLLAATSGKGTAEVPFDFQVQGHVLPAGMYSVTHSNTDGILFIRNEGTGETIAALAPVRKWGKAGDPKLTFNQYGDRYFLSAVWFGGEDGCGLVKSRQEKEISGDGKPGVLASIHLK